MGEMLRSYAVSLLIAKMGYEVKTRFKFVDKLENDSQYVFDKVSELHNRPDKVLSDIEEFLKYEGGLVMARDEMKNRIAEADSEQLLYLIRQLAKRSIIEVLKEKRVVGFPIPVGVFWRDIERMDHRIKAERYPEDLGGRGG